jgi:hypothetical protein
MIKYAVKYKQNYDFLVLGRSTEKCFNFPHELHRYNIATFDIIQDAKDFIIWTGLSGLEVVKIEPME